MSAAGKHSQPYPWEQVELNDIADKSTLKNRKNENKIVLTNSAELGIVKQQDYFDKDIANSKNLSNYYVVKNNYFVYNPRISNQAKYGPINYNSLGIVGIMSPLYFVFKVHNNVNNIFLGVLFKTSVWHRFMYENGDTGARADRFSIKDSVFMTMPLNIPSITEQSKIAKLFQSLDKTITLHEEKQCQLEQLKKALLQKMFADKTGYPALRFKGFTEKWEQEKLGNIIRQSSLKNNNYNYPILTSAHEGLVPQSTHFGSQQRHDTSDYNVIKPNQITYRNRSDDGRFTFNINKLNITGLVSKFYPVFSFENTDNDFMVNNLNHNPQIKYDLDVLSVGTGQHVLSFTNLKKYEILAPSYVEQKRIGQFLLQLNRTITLHDKKIQYLKQLKRGLLQKMFV